MLTIFAIPKAFCGHIALIQRNAIISWTLLRPKCEIILFGDEEGTAEIAAELGIRHMSYVERNEYGTPVLSYVFKVVHTIASRNLLAYLNADIMLMNDFTMTVEQVHSQKSKFLLVGERCDVDLKEQWDFGKPHWEASLKAYIAEVGRPHGCGGMDYFVFPHGLFRDIPPFLVGRPLWDSWMIYRARSLGVPVIDASSVVTVIHQNHDYTHVPLWNEEWWKDHPEAKHNLELYGVHDCAFRLDDATHILTSAGLRYALSIRHLQRHLDTLPVVFPYTAPLIWLPKAFLKVLLRMTKPVRVRLGLVPRSKVQDAKGRVPN